MLSTISPINKLGHAFMPVERRQDPASDFLRTLGGDSSSNPVDSPAPVASSPSIKVGGYSRVEYEKRAAKWRSRNQILSLRTFLTIVLVAGWIVGTASCVYEWLHGAIFTELAARFGAALVGAGIGGVAGFGAGTFLLLYLKLKLRRVRISDEYFPVTAFSVGVLGTVIGSVLALGFFIPCSAIGTWRCAR